MKNIMKTKWITCIGLFFNGIDGVSDDRNIDSYDVEEIDLDALSINAITESIFEGYIKVWFYANPESLTIKGSRKELRKLIESERNSST